MHRHILKKLHVIMFDAIFVSLIGDDDLPELYVIMLDFGEASLEGLATCRQPVCSDILSW
jgi:hypothetical protein